MSHEKNPLTFHCTGCLRGILIVVYYNPLYTLNNQGSFHCSNDVLVVMCYNGQLQTTLNQRKSSYTTHPKTNTSHLPQGPSEKETHLHLSHFFRCVLLVSRGLCFLFSNKYWFYPEPLWQFSHLIDIFLQLVTPHVFFVKLKDSCLTWPIIVLQDPADSGGRHPRWTHQADNFWSPRLYDPATISCREDERTKRWSTTSVPHHFPWRWRHRELP